MGQHQRVIGAFTGTRAPVDQQHKPGLHYDTGAWERVGGERGEGQREGFLEIVNECDKCGPPKTNVQNNGHQSHINSVNSVSEWKVH